MTLNQVGSPSPIATLPVSVLEAIKPFMADDGHKGTFLILRIAGLEQGTALKLVNRKYRSWQNWRATDDYFRELDDVVPVLAQRFGGEARVVRTALLDISIIETGISVFRRILTKQPVTEGMWAYAVKMAGLRVPMMGAEKESGSPWESLANSIRQTIAQRELTVVQELDGTKSITAKETVIEPSAEQKRVAQEIVDKMIRQAQERSN
jgi:hypothetical protein